MRALLIIPQMLDEAKKFCLSESSFDNLDLYGITDGKAVGTFVEHKFQNILSEKYDVAIGRSAKGIDFPAPEINTDIKVTSIRQPQSSCPFKSAEQKIFGLGYNLLLFVYNKIDNAQTKTARLDFVNCSFIGQNRTADYQITKSLLQLIENKANKEEIIAYLIERNLPADEIFLNQLAEKILEQPPQQGYLTISNALQWRLQYGRIVELNEPVDGIRRIAGNGKCAFHRVPSLERLPFLGRRRGFAGFFNPLKNRSVTDVQHSSDTPKADAFEIHLLCQLPSLFGFDIGPLNNSVMVSAIFA
jgi:hypothetical protein